MKKNLKYQCLSIALVVASLLSCGKDDETKTPSAEADFTFAVSTTEPGKVQFTDASKNATTYSWDFGDNTTASTEKSPSHTYAASGTHKVTLTAKGADGKASNKTQEVAVTVGTVGGGGGELITKGDMSDETAWTATGMGAPNLTVYSFANGKLTLTSSAEQNQVNLALWQEITVPEAGNYILSADVANDPSSTKTWLEFYIRKDKPAEAVDITQAADLFLKLQNWDACAGFDFEGNLKTHTDAAGECITGNGEGKNGVVALTAGTYYFVIKSGTWEGTLGSGIVIDNISLTKAP